MTEWLSHIDEYGGWLAAVVAGLVALGWLGRKARNGMRRLVDVGRKIDTLEELAVYELNHNGGNSIKDRIAQVPDINRRLGEVEAKLSAHLTATATVPPVTTVNVQAAPPAPAPAEES